MEHVIKKAALRLPFLLHELLLVYHKLELKPEPFRRLAAKDHSVHKNLEIVHNRAVTGIYAELELYQRMVFVYFELRFLYGVVDPVVDIESW